MGVWATREGVVKEEEIPEHWEAPSQGGPRGSCGSRAKQRTWSAENRKLHFSAHKQLMDCGPNQTAGSGNQGKSTEAPGAKGQPGCQEMPGIQTWNSEHTTCSAEGRCREQKHVNKLCNTEGGPGELRQVQQVKRYRGQAQ